MDVQPLGALLSRLAAQVPVAGHDADPSLPAKGPRPDTVQYDLIGRHVPGETDSKVGLGLKRARQSPSFTVEKNLDLDAPDKAAAELAERLDEGRAVAFFLDIKTRRIAPQNPDHIGPIHAVELHQDQVYNTAWALPRALDNPTLSL